MKVINFLPDDYMQRRTRRQTNKVCLMVAGGALLVLGVLVGFILLRSAHVAGMRAIVEQQYREATKQLEQLKQLEAQKEGLLKKVELSTKLLERVPRSQILARLTNALPPNTNIQTLTMTTEEVQVPVRTAAAAAAAPKPAPPGKRGPQAKAAMEKVREIQFRVDGLAPTDVEVAEYISRLSADPFFVEVNLQFSEDFMYEETLRLRRYQIVFKLTKAAEKLLESPPVDAKATAAAPGAALPTRGGT